MTSSKDTCEPFREKRNDSKVRVREYGKSAVFLNPGRKDVFVTKVDGGLVNHQLAADYVVSFPDTGNIIVELKGKEIRHACEQILATAKLLERCGAPRRAVGALIVCTRVPSTDSTTSRLKNEFLKKHGTRLHIKSGNLEHDALKLIGK